MSALVETESKPVEPVAPVVDGSSSAPAETAAPVEEYKKEVRVVPLPQSLRPLTSPSALSGGPEAHCELPALALSNHLIFFPDFLRSLHPLPLCPLLP